MFGLLMHYAKRLIPPIFILRKRSSILKNLKLKKHTLQIFILIWITLLFAKICRITSVRPMMGLKPDAKTPITLLYGLNNSVISVTVDEINLAIQ